MAVNFKKSCTIDGEDISGGGGGPVSSRELRVEKKVLCAVSLQFRIKPDMHTHTLTGTHMHAYTHREKKHHFTP